MEVRPGYKKTEVGVIPEDWEVKLLSSLSTISRLAGAEYTSLWKETPNGEIIALRGFNIGQGKIIEREIVRISKTLSLKLKRSKLCKGDVVYPCVGSIGNAVVITDDDKYHIQQNIARITPNLAVIDSCYLTYYLMSSFAQREIGRFNSSSSQPSVLVGSLRQYRVPLSKNLPEQRAIATALSDMDALNAGLDKLITKKRDLKHAAMQQLLTGKTRLPGFSGKWEVKRLGDIGKFKNGLNKDSSAFGHGSPFVNLMDVFGVNRISSTSHLGLVASTKMDQDVYDLRQGDVLFIRSSVKPSGVGLTAVIERDLPDTVYSGFLIRFRDDGALDRNFKKHCFYAEHFRKTIIAASSVSANTNINQNSLGALTMLLPLLPEQTAIAKVLSDMDTEIATLETRLEKTRALKQGMMQELLTGRIRLA
jgi:type I restriction enzyme S subunit